MLGRTYDGQNCSVARALESVGDRWGLLIIRDALLRGITRFSDFQRSLAIAPNILATRLEGFVDAGLMQIRPHPDRPRPDDYLLPDNNRAPAPVILALTHWGDRWAAPTGLPFRFPPLVFSRAIHQQIHCDIC